MYIRFSTSHVSLREQHIDITPLIFYLQVWRYLQTYNTLTQSFPSLTMSALHARLQSANKIFGEIHEGTDLDYNCLNERYLYFINLHSHFVEGNIDSTEEQEKMLHTLSNLYIAFLKEVNEICKEKW